MKANELRIGNYVTADADRNQLYDIQPHHFTHDDFMDLIEPIPLTEEWLIKANFKFKELGLNDISVSHGLTSGDIHFVVGNYYVKLDYVHELQNIYMSFVKQELEFNQ